MKDASSRISLAKLVIKYVRMMIHRNIVQPLQVELAQKRSAIDGSCRREAPGLTTRHNHRDEAELIRKDRLTGMICRPIPFGARHNYDSKMDVGRSVKHYDPR